MNEQAASLIDENKITSAEYYAIKSLYNESKNMNFDYIINANSAIENKLNIITDKLS
jgi:tRNA A37 threonylcarbamoyladenosine dehydratase